MERWWEALVLRTPAISHPRAGFQLRMSRPLIVGNYMNVMWQALYQRKERKIHQMLKEKLSFSMHHAKLLEILSQLGSVYEVRVIDSSDSSRTEGELFFLFQSSDWWLRTLDTDLKNNSLSSICRWWDYFDCNLFRIRTWN